jgi:V-type H+-transporting ATPase subunit C
VYNIDAWHTEKQERSMLTEQLANKTTVLRQTAVSNFQVLFEALMHLKVIRAYIDGVLRFGIPPKFFVGIVMPKKGVEKSILQELTKTLAD